MNKVLLAISAAGGLVMASSAAYANKQASYPKISGEAVFELQLENGVDSDNANNERTNAFLRTEVAPKIAFNENFYIDGVAVLEQLKDGTPGDDTYFENEGIFFEELKLNYENGQWAAFAGKFNPAFGTAWDVRGVWGEDFAEGYEVTEKVGFGGAYTFETPNAGNHTFTASTFFADTSFLTESVITGRGDTQKTDGGVSNTEDFSNFAVSIDGENVAGVENLSYHLGFRHLAAGDADAAGTKDDQAIAIGTNYSFDVTESLNSDVLLEYVSISNAEGTTVDVNYYTASVINTYDNWNLTLAYTKRDTDNPIAADLDDHLLQVSAGYDFGNGLTLEAGWRNAEESNVSTDTIGGLARYTVEF